MVGLVPGYVKFQPNIIFLACNNVILLCWFFLILFPVYDFSIFVCVSLLLFVQNPPVNNHTSERGQFWNYPF